MAFVLDNGDAIRGVASAATVVDYTVFGLDGTDLKQLADGQLAAAEADLYLASGVDTVATMILVNTDTSARTINLYHKPSGGTSRRIIPKDLSLTAGYSLHTDGNEVCVYDTNGVLQIKLAAHKDSHDPNDGSDPLDTANAASIAGVQAAATGTSHSLARADHVHGIAHSIADNALVTIDHVTPADNDYAKFTVSGLEGRSYAQVLADLSGNAAAAFSFNSQNVTNVGEIQLTPKASSTGAEGTMFYDSDDDHVYVGTE